MAAFDIVKAKKNLLAREESTRIKRSELHAIAQQDLMRIADFLIEKYQPAKLYTWGSILEPKMFTEKSDIDIALEGLSGPLDGLHAKSDAESFTDFSIDLVELERIHPLHAGTIRERGKLLYERK